MKPDTKLTTIVFSYIPFLSGTPGAVIDPNKLHDIGEMIDSLPSGEALGCVWLRSRTDPNKVSPVLLYNNVKGLLEHLFAWCEDKPLDWFDLHLRESQGKYIFALVPKVEKSVERHRIAYQLMNGYPLPKDINTKIMFKPLFMVNGDNSNVFNEHRDKISDTLEIGFLDMSRIDMNNPAKSMQEIEDSEIKWLGQFKLADNTVMGEYLDAILADTKPRKCD